MGRNVFPLLFTPPEPLDLSHLPPEIREIWLRNTALMNEGRSLNIDIGISNPYRCSCCGKQHIDLTIEQKVTITPEGADEPLPEEPTEVEITQPVLSVAIDIFNTLVKDYKDLLTAEVLNMADSDILETISEGDWTWDQDSKQYENTDTGEIIADDALLMIRDELIYIWHDRIRELAQQLVDGEVTIQSWLLRMQEEIISVYADEYMLSKGGYNALFEPDITILAEILLEQYTYLQDFAADIQQGTLSQAQIGNRSELYIESATQAHERGKARRHGIDLPAYPADGSQDCMTRCKCHWNINETEERVNAYWTLDPSAEHCDTCVANSQDWAPYYVLFE